METKNPEPAKKPEPIVVKARLRIGGYGSKPLAEADSMFFRHPRVFEDRSILFPRPRDYQVTPRTVGVSTGEWPKPPNPLNTHYVEVIMEVRGQPGKIDQWLKDTLGRTSRYASKAEMERIEDEDVETE